MYIKKLFDYLKPLARNFLCNLIVSQNRAIFSCYTIVSRYKWRAETQTLENV